MGKAKISIGNKKVLMPVLVLVFLSFTTLIEGP